ncbi:MAG TPA: prolyl oligopeptidase family serine peptidase [Gemmatimonadales bacterium]|nr:prolyl oligopeptidase family serine peptidase [Gemmatimonadales bacterium]
MRRVVSLVFGTLCAAAPAVQAQQASTPFTLPQILDYPYPSELVAAPSGAAIAWVLNERGVRNIWTASAFENWTPRRLTKYSEDDGQELTNLAFMPDGKTIVYVRGGDHDANWPAEGGLAPDPASSPEQAKMGIWAIELTGGTPRFLAEGDAPVVSPRNDRIAFVKDDQVWAVSFFSTRPAAQLFFSRAKSGSPVWSPDGSALAFVSDRGDHSFIGVFRSDTEPIRYLAPSTGRDFFPRWSPDGKQIAFVRMPGEGGPPEPMLVNVPAPWSIWVADAASGAGKQVWTSPRTLHGSYPETAGEANLNWGANDALVFLADLDGWPHLYSVPMAGGATLLLTPGAFMVEHVAIAPDHRFLVYSANTGASANDGERRHLFRVPVDRAAPVAVTSGDGLEWTPVITNDGSTIGFISAEPRRPPVPAVVPVAGGQLQLLGLDQVPADFPSASLVLPRAVAFRAPDGTMVHGTLFERPGVSGKHAGLVFVHGGPPRQMLLGWHYMDYYSNAYAVNQYLASRGFVVLSVNYRLGIGYGHDFHHPEHAGPAGAAEYQDVLAGGRYLAGLPEVDPARVGIWGGSYGGFLTAMALARNSNVFATGVDLHGVHDWTGGMGDGPGRVERGDWDSARVVAWRSSPVASIKTWKSPVLLIHGDDDRNVRFHQTVDLARRLDAAGVRYEELVLPDEIHGFLRHGSWLTADSATVTYLGRVLREGP